MGGSPSLYRLTCNENTRFPTETWLIWPPKTLSAAINADHLVVMVDHLVVVAAADHPAAEVVQVVVVGNLEAEEPLAVHLPVHLAVVVAIVVRAANMVIVTWIKIDYVVEWI